MFHKLQKLIGLTNCFYQAEKIIPSVNITYWRGYNSLAIDTHLHIIITFLVLCSFQIKSSYSLAVSQPKYPDYSSIFTS